MNRFEKRKLKTNLYKHGNTIMYVVIFAMASLITIAAAANRTGKIEYVDESLIASTEKESLAVKNSSTNKVASTETNAQATTEAVTEEATQPQTTESPTEPVSVIQVRVIADTLIVRSQASQDSDMIGMVDMDQVFDVISQNGDWIEINYNGTTGYISSEFTEVVE